MIVQDLALARRRPWLVGSDAFRQMFFHFGKVLDAISGKRDVLPRGSDLRDDVVTLAAEGRGFGVEGSLNVLEIAIANGYRMFWKVIASARDGCSRLSEGTRSAEAGVEILAGWIRAPYLDSRLASTLGATNGTRKAAEQEIENTHK